MGQRDFCASGGVVCRNNIQVITKIIIFQILRFYNRETVRQRLHPTSPTQRGSLVEGGVVGMH